MDDRTLEIIFERVNLACEAYLTEKVGTDARKTAGIKFGALYDLICEAGLEDDYSVWLEQTE